MYVMYETERRSMQPEFATSLTYRFPRKAESRVKDAASLSPFLVLIVLVLFVPDELSLYLGAFRLSLIRLILFPLAPILLASLVLSAASGKRHLIATDIFVIATGVWIIAAATIVTDFGSAIHHNAPQAAEYCGAYLATRVLLSKPGQALKFVSFLCHVIAIVGLFGIADVLGNGPVIHIMLGRHYLLATDHRWGLVRAEGLLDHPILLGTVCAIGLVLATGSAVRAKLPTIAACGLGTFLSLSGGPWQAAAVGLGFLAYDRMFAKIRYRWWLLVEIVLLAYGAAHAVSSSPLTFILTHSLLTANSYWTRVYQWNTVGQIVLQSPWFGIAQNLKEEAQQMSLFVIQSVDSIWLLQALEYGIPGSVILFLSMVSVIFYRTGGPAVNLTAENSRLAFALNVVMVVLIVEGFSVSYWGATWMLSGLVLGVRAHLVDIGRTAAEPGKTPERAKAGRQRNRRLAVPAV